MATQSLRRLAAILLPLLVTAVFAGKTQLLSHGFYSGDPNYRYQTNAFLLGHLAVRDSPTNHRHDWAWNDGAYQIWGLGVPLLRLPFEAVASVFHRDFPDRFVFLLLHFLTGVALFTAAWGVRGFFFRSSVLVMLLLGPQFLMLVGANRFHVYEEAIAYNVLWAWLGLALCLNSIAGSPAKRKTAPRSWLLFGFVAGFSILIRPTGILWGSLSFVFFLFHRRKAGKKLLPVCALFLAGPAFALLTNELRFGSPWSFGHAISLPNRADIFFSLRWGHPFRSEPFLRAARELFGGLWTTDNIKAWQSSTFRYREIYFGANFDVLLIAAAAACVIPPFFRRVRSINVMVPWALVSFAGLFLFYLRFNGLVSRYFSEFIPSVYVALAAAVAFWFTALETLRVRRYATMFAALFFAGLLTSVLLFTPRGGGFLTGAKQPDNVSAYAAAKAVGPWSLPQPSLPDVYWCGMANPNQEIPYNGFGWAMSTICDVSEATMLFFSNLNCLELTYASSVPPDLRVTVGLESWHRISLEHAGNSVATFTAKYCPATPEVALAKPSSIKLVVIGWVNPEMLGSDRQSHLRLQSVRNAPWPL